MTKWFVFIIKAYKTCQRVKINKAGLTILEFEVRLGKKNRETKQQIKKRDKYNASVQ